MHTEELERVKAVFFDNLISGKREPCRTVINDAIKTGLKLECVYEEVLRPALYEVGKLWEYNKISVATEHIASAIVEGILNQIYKELTLTHENEKTVLIACLENEHHQIGAKMLSDIFEQNNWQTYFLGANMPTQELMSFARISQPQVFAISVSIYHHLPDFEKLIKEIRLDFPKTPILAGGQAFLKGGLDVIKQLGGIQYFPDLYSLSHYLKSNEL